MSKVGRATGGKHPRLNPSPPGRACCEGQKEQKYKNFVNILVSQSWSTVRIYIVHTSGLAVCISDPWYKVKRDGNKNIMVSQSC